MPQCTPTQHNNKKNKIRKYWVYIPHMRENMQPLAFWSWLILPKMMFSISIHTYLQVTKFHYMWIYIYMYLNRAPSAEAQVLSGRALA
jgi:hypothetical protein